MKKKALFKILLPAGITAALAGAMILGMCLNSYVIRRQLRSMPEIFFPQIGGENAKLDMVMNMLKYAYVDSVDVNKIEETAIQSVIKELDPHTVYIPLEDMPKVTEDMAGNFGGIGIQFYKYLDTVTVIRAIPDGPSARQGVKAGDRIVKVNDSIVAGRKMEDKKIMSMMRGEMGTSVNITILRRGEKSLITKQITRGAIPVKSVDAAYMVNDTIGYIKVNTFGMNTYDEFMDALNKLKNAGMKKAIVDLRNNEGGLLPIALKMVNEFLEAEQLILYTKGKAYPRTDYYSNGRGIYKELALSVLINESSASASEIFAGAIQDNDRGQIVGRRSFGKGLVQEQRVLPDGSALRLTVARYYVPSGRSIQRSYSEGKEKYYSDFYDRVLHGELEAKDSIHFDESQRFQTVGGRTVYGGGGIMPDIFVPADTLGYSDYFVQLNRSMQLYNYTFDFMDRHRTEMEKCKNYREVQKLLSKYDIVGEMVQYAAKNGIKKSDKGLKDSYSLIKNQLEAYIARHVLDDAGFYPILGLTDVTLLEAIKN